MRHQQGLQVQEVQYDPVGLELAGLSLPSPGIRGLNNYRFNGKEFQMDLGLNWNHQDWRFFDPQRLQWNGVDPEIENGQESWGPYSFGYDNAVRFNDPNGRCPTCPPAPMLGALWEEGVQMAQEFGPYAGPAVVITAGLVVGVLAKEVIEAGATSSSSYNLAGDTTGPYQYVTQNGNPAKASYTTTTQAPPKPISSRQVSANSPNNNSASPANTSPKVTMKNGSELPAPGKGKGSVPPNQRDPKRGLTKSERQEMLNQRGGKCEGCDKPATADDVQAHHVQRHADGGKTVQADMVNLCKDCSSTSS